MAEQHHILRALRLDKKLTQKDVAGKLRVSQPHVSQIERGEKPHSIFEATKTVNKMRSRTDRTPGGPVKAGRKK